MDDDRFMVLSWGRAGSLALAEVLEQHLLDRGPGSVTWHHVVPHAVVPSQPWSIYVGNGLEQLVETKHMGCVVALRQPALAALSSSLVGRQGYVHVHAPERVRQAWQRLHVGAWAAKHDYYARVVRDSWAARDSVPVTVPMDELRYRRLTCMNWNDIAVHHLSGRALPMVFDAWHGDTSLAASMMGVPAPKDITVMKDPRPLLDRVANAEEVASWLDSCRDEDAGMMATWHRGLSGR